MERGLAKTRDAEWLKQVKRQKRRKKIINTPRLISRWSEKNDNRMIAYTTMYSEAGATR